MLQKDENDVSRHSMRIALTKCPYNFAENRRVNKSTGLNFSSKFEVNSLE